MSAEHEYGGGMTAVTAEMEQEAAGYNEAGFAVMTLWLGGIINDEGVEIDRRQYSGVRFQYGDSAEREFKQVVVNMAGSAPSTWHHGLGKSRSDRKSAELDSVICEVRDEDLMIPSRWRRLWRHS
jgi:hypothetical protein